MLFNSHLSLFHFLHRHIAGQRTHLQRIWTRSPFMLLPLAAFFWGIFLAQTRSVLINWTHFFSVPLSRDVTLAVLIHRNRFWGSWARASVLIRVLYVNLNITLVFFFRTNSLTGAGRWAGELALINMIFPLSAIHLGYLADFPSPVG